MLVGYKISKRIQDDDEKTEYYLFVNYPSILLKEKRI